MAMELFLYAQSKGVGGVFYVNRKLLLPQTLSQMEAAGLPCAVRAAEYEHYFDADMPFQVSSAPSEQQRVFKSGKWNIHDVGEGGIVVIDEAHIQKTATVKKLLYYYMNRGAIIILLSATPIAMKDWADDIVIDPSIKEWQEAGAIVPAVTLTVSQPDLSKVKREKSGEFKLKDKRIRKIFTQHVVADCVENVAKNYDGSPCLIYGPDVPGSRFLAQQCTKRGMKVAHVDATEAMIGDKTYQLTPSVWEDISSMVKGGDLMGLSCRFKLREGVDIPSTSLVVTACPIGSLASYLQICGRGMRSSPGKTKMVLQDHGGVYHTHGSPNVNRDWRSIWKMSHGVASSLYQTEIKEGREPEPIRCPSPPVGCGAERRHGRKCHVCGFEHPRSVRVVISEPGELQEVHGNMIKKTRRVMRSDTEAKWTRMFYAFRNNPNNTRTFAQMEAFYFRENNYRPVIDGTLPFMPRYAHDWKLPVSDVPMHRLTGRNKEEVTTR